MRALETWILAYLLNSLWQIPLIFFAAWAAARMVRLAGIRMEHRVWVSALILQVTLPACHFHLGSLWQQLWEYALQFRSGGAGSGVVRIVMGAGAVSGSGALQLPAALLTALLLAYGCSLLYFAGRMVWGLWTTDAMCRQAIRVILPDDVARKAAQFGHLLGIGTMQIAVSPRIAGPMTVGVVRRRLLLPPEFLECVAESDLDAVLAHEFAHMRRMDFAKNLLYGVIAVPIAWHPVLWLTRSRLAETREMVCDAMAAEAVTGREDYARALLRLASMLSDRTPARTLHAIGILDANTFERRVMNLTRKNVEIQGLRRFAIVAACGAVAAATCASALALRINIAAPAAQSAADAPKRVRVKVDYLTILSHKVPVYPAEAKANKDTINGPVVLAVIIGKDGAPVQVEVKKSLREDYDSSALEAVRQWRWQPYLLNGDPIEVETTVTVAYSIEE